MLSRRVAQSTIGAATRQPFLASRTTAIRGYATPTVDSKPPVAIYGIDGTYASALVRNPYSYFSVLRLPIVVHFYKTPL